ncbi:phosphatidylinositol mannoside acyltransferase [Rarobacter incanus]|uniref:KDO2-lipid IV(A) lauroyltransferase n=1 Tax=Rarobacter incanus TaxID=153494 RepID=A0A542SMN2_9MICO|nr:phosphatidylinositol mannoside acyltransferase [Rarobacter incanus]TQK75889.1 KDO2-lipid IV(A) lauroyltransferase [Rarobacter incanus]
MRKPSAATAFHLAWKILPRLPHDFTLALADVAADVVWAARGTGVRRLEANLARVRPADAGSGVRWLARRGMRSYFRYFVEAFALSGMSAGQIAARVRPVGIEPARAHIAQGKSVVLALGHMGNWDLAGAWSATHFAPVTTVAERLKPAEVFDEFVAFRESLGMQILAFGDDGVFRELQRAARAGGRIVPLLADRDLGRSGVEATLSGQRVRVAAGPAALAISTGAPLFALGIRYERLRGSRRRAAASRWGIVLDFSHQIAVDDVTGPTREKVRVVTQRWVDALGACIERSPQDWHMLQKVFISDLDPDRYRSITGEP